MRALARGGLRALLENLARNVPGRRRAADR